MYCRILYYIILCYTILTHQQGATTSRPWPAASSKINTLNVYSENKKNDKTKQNYNNT